MACTYGRYCRSMNRYVVQGVGEHHENKSSLSRTIDACKDRETTPIRAFTIRVKCATDPIQMSPSNLRARRPQNPLDFHRYPLCLKHFHTKKLHRYPHKNPKRGLCKDGETNSKRHNSHTPCKEYNKGCASLSVLYKIKVLSRS